MPELFHLPQLPYSIEALEPYISAKTMEAHHGGNAASYVSHLDEAIIGTPYENMGLEQIIRSIVGEKKFGLAGKSEKIYNYAAQHWNHSFFWNCLKPNSCKIPHRLRNLFISSFGSTEDFKAKFTTNADGLFGSGWTWLIQDMNTGKLVIQNSHNAGTPITNESLNPLLTLDMWEHAYYLDYQSKKKKYIDAFFYLVNWEFCESNLK